MEQLVYPPCCMRQKLCHVLNLLLNDYVVNLLLLVNVAIWCTCILLSFVVVFFVAVIFCMFLLSTAENSSLN